MLFFLIFNSISIKCKYSVTITDNLPKTYTFDADEGEHICVNSTSPFLTAVFHNSLLKVRYFQIPSIGDLIDLGEFLFPAEKGGISFGADKGSIDIMALLPGNISFSVLAYSPSCGQYRLISTKANTEINVRTTFGPFSKSQKCIWYPQRNFKATISEIPEYPDSVSLCSNETKCNEPFEKALTPIKITSPSSIIISASSEAYYNELELTLESLKERGGFLTPFETETKLDLTRITLFDIIYSEKTSEVKENNNVENDDDSDENENEPKEEEEKIKKPLIYPPKHGKKESTRRYLSTGEKLAFLAVLIAVFIIIIQCFYCGGKETISRTFKKKTNEDRESELRLLSNQQNSEHLRQNVYNMGNQMPITGVYFPPTTATIDDGQQQQQNLQMQTPQPLMLIPTAIGPSTNQNNQQQPLFYPQMMPANSQQPYYPQYGFVTVQTPFNQPQVQQPQNK